MQTKITHGSLFSGIGGFDYAGELCGIKTLWVCEIEPAPVAILRRHFPDAAQLGNIMEVHGGEIAPVDVLTFGSPCQGMSVAGTRCGLDSDQSESVLFYEAARIIYEMREATNGEYPKIIIWENVPGAYSSNKGMDFRAVLETLTKSPVPMPQSGRWATSGMVRGGQLTSHGEHPMPNIGESPSEERESNLLEILQEDAPRDYYLSATACRGILRRAENKGKELPPILKMVLEQQSGILQTTDKTAEQRDHATQQKQSPQSTAPAETTHLL